MSKKLLLADDSITIQKVIQITFAHEDYELVIADNGDSALDMARQSKPDLVMADVYMPGKNGYELTSAIKQDPLLQHVPVLLLAGSFEPFDEDKARSCKADAWIEKPFESQSLIDKVAELLSAAQPAPQAAAPAAGPEAAAVAEPATMTEFAPVAGPAELEPAMAEEDPFADISFEEEPAAAEEVSEEEVEALADTEDWSDVAAESEFAEPALEDDFAIVEEPPVDDFSFADEELEVAGPAPVAVAEGGLDEFDAFEMDDDEIMPLDDDDILGEEDLEPVMQEQTLAAWSRDETVGEDAFVESLAEPSIEEDESVFALAADEVALDDEAVDRVEEPAVFAEDEFAEIAEPEVEMTTEFAEPVVAAVPEEEPAPVVEEEPAPVVEEAKPAAVAASMADVVKKAAAVSEEEIDQIIERVVSKIVEKLADSIVERVAWEVVPDLAEKMIRDEIRKIKDSAA